MLYDLLVKGGRVLDPGQGIDGRFDIGVTNGKIAALKPDISAAEAHATVSAKDKLVVPGLIDIHCHVYAGVLNQGVEPDLIGVRAGVTTLLDAGSAGAYTFGGFPRFILPSSRTQVLCMLHVARTGLSYMPEIRDRQDIDLEAMLRVAQAHPDLIQGFKVRAVGPAVKELGTEMVKLGRQAASETGSRLMVHIGDPQFKMEPPLTQSLLPLLQQGDIITHLYTGAPGNILDTNNRVLPELQDAAQRGVYLDPAHGRFNLSFDVARRAMDQGVPPFTISTDLTTPGRLKPAHSLTEIMSKFLALGLSLGDVVRCTTANAAMALGRQQYLGTLAQGTVADITILEVVKGDWTFTDCQGDTITGDTALRPALTIKDGVPYAPEWGPHPWGWLPNAVE